MMTELDEKIKNCDQLIKNYENPGIIYEILKILNFLYI